MKLSALLAALAVVPLGMIPLGLGKPAAGDPPKVRTHLMFEGDAEEAMKLYVSLVPGSKILDVQRYGRDEPGAGSIKVATFALAGTEYVCIDSYVDHPFTFTAAMSLFVTFGSEAEVDTFFAKLSEGGQVFMPLQAYPFSRRFAWFADRFGVSWQVSCAG